MRPPICYGISDHQFVKKGTWSPEEDELLVAYIRRYGIWNWTEMPKAAGLMRSGKSCRLRWMNYLKPTIKRGNYSKEEEDIILKLHAKLGNKWASIAARLPGRTDNDIKNYWHTHLKKRINIKPKEEKLQTNVAPMQGMDTIKPDAGKNQCVNSPQKEQKPAIPVASDSEHSTSSSSASWVPPRGLWDDDQVNAFSMDSVSLIEDNSWSPYTDSYSSWFEDSAIYSYTSNEELARDFWNGLFMH